MNCGVCKEKVNFECYIVFRSWKNGYPTAWMTNMDLVHPNCADQDSWYVVPAYFASRKDIEDWVFHLSQKKWFTPLMVDGFRDLCAEAVALQMRHRVHNFPNHREHPRHIGGGDRAKVMERDGFRCQRCGCGPKVRPLVVDHIYPVSKGGGRDLANLQTLCALCNAGKGHRYPDLHDLVHA